jgi:hypothetical protein
MSLSFASKHTLCSVSGRLLLLLMSVRLILYDVSDLTRLYLLGSSILCRLRILSSGLLGLVTWLHLLLLLTV